jgi:hypothetical protein
VDDVEGGGGGCVHGKTSWLIIREDGPGPVINDSRQ